MCLTSHPATQRVISITRNKMDAVVMWRLMTGGCTIVLVSLVAYLSWLRYLKHRAFKLCGHHVHFLPDLPILGNALIFLPLRTSADVWNFITEYSNRYGQGVFFWLFHLPWIIVRDIEVVEAILTSGDSIEKSHVYRLLDTITDGVFSANGNRWKKLRKKLNLTFSPRQLDLLYDDMNEQTAIAVQVLSKNTDKYINIMSFMTTFFFDVVSRTHFGVATKEQQERNFQITEKAANVVQLTMENRVFKPQNHLLLLFKSTRVNQFINYMRKEPLIFIRKMIAQRLKEADIEKTEGLNGEKRRVYYVDTAKEALEDLNIEPTPYNLERNTGDMLIAASDTTSIAVSTVFYYLSLYPDIQEKVYEEVLPIFGESSTKDLTKEDINSMEYLEMVIKETLRHTAPPGIIRELTQDLDVGKYVIPKRTNVYLTLKSIHKNPDFYERVEEFYPDHFLPEAVKQRPKFAFLPFSAGLRNCPGMTYSYVTMKAIISSVVRNFKLETNIPLKDIEYKMVLMQEHKNGYFIRLKAR